MDHTEMSLIPPPTDHKHDPLRWPRWLKLSAVLTASLCNFVSNMAASGPSVAIRKFMEGFSKTQDQVTQLLTVDPLDLHVCRVILKKG